jgi:type II pantothenate kinase
MNTTSWPAPALPDGTIAAVDFGGTNIDVLIWQEGRFARAFFPSGRPISCALLRDVLIRAGAPLAALRWIAVTGGRHQELPDTIESTPIVKIAELRAVARGGLLASGRNEALVASLGTGTLFVGARGERVLHLGGSGVGGGTLLGLSRLLLGTADAPTIDALARRGDAARIDLSVGEIVGGGVGMIPPTATAAHFGKAAGIVAGTWIGDDRQPGREDVAAALMNLVGQTVLRLALLAASAHGFQTTILLGHLAELEGIAHTAAGMARLFGGEVIIPPHAGHAIALGALAEAVVVATSR